jgi:hypothetical protein
VKFRLATLAGLAILAAGCGGSGGSSSDAADLVPPDALAYMTLDSDLGSAQLKSAQSILNKFPIKAQVLQALRSSASSNGVGLRALEGAVGPEVDVAALRITGKTGAVAFTQPSDEKAFDAQLDKGPKPLLHEKIGGWTAVSDNQAFLDAVKHRSGKLSDDLAYTAAVATLPAAGEAIARVFVTPAAIQTGSSALPALPGGTSSLGLGAKTKWVAGALTSKDGAFKLEVHAKGGSAASAPASSALVGEIPSGSILALHLAGGGASVPANLGTQAGALSKQLGFDATALLGALNGPVIAYVRAAIPLPEVTVVARPAQPKRTVEAIAKLVTTFTQGQVAAVPTKVADGTLQKADLGSVSVYYGSSGSDVVVSDSANVLAELKGSVGHLSGDGVFTEARDAAGMPDANQGFLFVDLKDALPALSGFADLANQKLPPSVEANLKPLRSLLVYGARNGDLQTFVAYLKTS